MMFATGQLNGKRRDARAFTLVELILVMTILATLMAVVAPSMSGFFRGRKQDSEARRLLSLIRYGQSRAVSEGVPAMLWIDERNNTYGLELVPGYSNQEDSKSIDLEVDKDLTIEAGRSLAKTLVRGQTLPAIRMEPDGSFDLTSPETIRVREGQSSPVWVVKSPNGLSYEIENQNRAIEKAFR